MNQKEAEMKKKLDDAFAYRKATEFNDVISDIWLNEQGVFNEDERLCLKIKNAMKLAANLNDCQKNGWPALLNTHKDTPWSVVSDLGRPQKCTFMGCQENATKRMIEKNELWGTILCGKHYEQVKEMVLLCGPSMWETKKEET
jgi:hypothetical protein